jgi:hypothetical protein
MFRRILIAATFVAALGAAGLGMSSTAEARHGCYGGGHHGHGGYGGHHGRGHGYGHGHSAYYPSYGYRSFYGPSYGAYYVPYYNYYPYNTGIQFSIGF